MLVFAALLLAQVIDPSDIPDAATAMAEVNDQKALVDSIDAEVTTLLTDAKTINASTAMKKEESDALQVKYPGIAVSPDFDAAQLVRALRTEQNLQRLKLGKIASIAAYRSCLETAEHTAKAKSLYEQVLKDPEYLRQPLSERIKLRNAIEGELAKAPTEPCDSYLTLPTMNDDMTMKE